MKKFTITKENVSEIRKGVPLPVKHRTPANRDTYRFGRMEVGDSIVIRVPGCDITNLARNVSSAISSYRKTTAPDKKFATRKLSKDSIGVWRTE